MSQRNVSNGIFSEHVTVLSCSGVGLAFPRFEEHEVWRLTLGRLNENTAIQVLEGVSVEIPKGRFVGILGRNGAGKTSLLRVLGGIYSATVGKVECSGDVMGLFDLGVFGNRRLSGREYAKRFLSIQGISRVNLSRMLSDIREFSELSDRFDDPIFSYSSGMLARLYFSTATAVPSTVYLIDEFLMVGDEYFQGKCWKRLRERMAEGTAGVLVTHDWTTLLSLCGTAHLLSRGRIVKSGPSDEIAREYLSPPVPERSDIASFTHDLPLEYCARTFEDTEWVFRVRVKQPTPVVFGYSVEILQPGVRWSILLMGENIPVASQAGEYEVRLYIPEFPLAPGRYLLNVFLNAVQPDSLSPRMVACDVRGWTYGNPLNEVEGIITAIFTLGLGLKEDLTGRENIIADARLQGRNRQEIWKVLNEIVGFADLGDFIDCPVRTYSSGMKARLAFSLIIHVDPEILIVDEALSAGDYSFGIKAAKKMREICERGKITILVSHNMRSIVDLCTRCLWIEAGQVVRDGDPQEVTQAYLDSERARVEFLSETMREAIRVATYRRKARRSLICKSGRVV